MFEISWMELVEGGGRITESILLAGWRTLPAFCVALAISLLLRNRISASSHAVLWTIVMVRLFLPVSFENPYNFHALSDSLFQMRVERTDQAAIHEVYRAEFSPVGQATAALPQPIGATAVPEEPFDYLQFALGLVALGVPTISCFLFARLVIGHILFWRKLNRAPLLENARLQTILARECEDLRVSHQPTVREMASLSTPAVFGFFRHTLCLPQGTIERLSDQELTWIVRHELAHIRRWDSLTIMLGSAAKAIHWFNPLVYFAASRLRLAVEQAADDKATYKATGNERIAYCHLLLAIAEGGTTKTVSPALGLLTFRPGLDLKARVARLTVGRVRSSRTLKLIVFVLVACFAWLSLTDASDEPTSPPLNYLEDDDQYVASAPDSSARILTKYEESKVRFLNTYDAQPLFDRLAKTEEERNQLRLELSAIGSLIGEPDAVKLTEDNKLIANLPVTSQASLANLVKHWKLGGPDQIMIETRFIHAPLSLLKDVDWADRQLPEVSTENRPGMAILASKQEVEQLTTKANRDLKANSMSCPRVTMFNGQSASIKDCVRRPFITNVRLDSKRQVVQEVEILDEGNSLELTTEITPGNSVTVQACFTQSEITEVRKATVPLNAGRTADVQVPIVKKNKVEVAVAAADGETILISIPDVVPNDAKSKEQMATFVLITPKVLRTDETRK